MPTEEGNYHKDKEEFADALDDIFNADPGLSDEELNKQLDEKEEKRKTDEAGDATGDQSHIVTHDPLKPAEEDPTPAEDKTGQSPTATDPAKSTTVKKDDDGIDWKARCLEAEDLLAKEKHRTKSWNGRIKAETTKVKELEAEVARLKADSGEEPTTQADHMAKFKNEFPELHGMFELQQKEIDALKGNVQVDPDEYPVEDPTQPTDPTDDPHFITIESVHPDKDEMVNTGVLKTWINTQSDLLRPTYNRIYAKGTADEVIKMITEFKEKTGWKSSILTDNGEAQEKEDKLKSMTEVNSESSGPVDRTGPDKNDYDQGVKDAFK